MVREKTVSDKRASASEEDELDVLAENISRILEEGYAQTYSPEVIAEFRNPANVGLLEDADGKGVADGLCNDTIEMYIKVRNRRIVACTFMTDGCGATIACASRLTRFVKGMAVDEAMMVTPNDLISLLNGLPEEHRHCAALAVLALRNAIRDHRSRRKKEGKT